MALTKEQLELRKSCVGGSDAAAILGIDPDKSAFDVWLEKTGKVEDWEGNEATRRGNWMEPSLILFAEHELGVKLERDVLVRSIAYPRLASNLDAFWADKFAPVEAKSTVKEEDWGEPSTDDVPKRVIVQTHMQMLCIGPKSVFCPVPMVIPGFKHFEFRMYRVERNDKLAEDIAGACLEFWDQHVQRDIPPEDSRPSLELVKRIKREPAKVIDLPDIAIMKLAALDEAKAYRKDSEEGVDRLQAELLAMLGDAEAGRLPDGRTIQYMLQNRKGYDVQACAFRQMRVKGGK